MVQMANMLINGLSIPARIEARDTYPKNGRLKEHLLQWPKKLMSDAIYAQGAELGLVEACQWVSPAEIEQQLQAERTKMAEEMKAMLKRNPAGKVELEAIPTALITATLDGMRISNNDEINIISDTDSEEEEGEIVGNVSTDWAPETARSSGQQYPVYNIMPQLIRPTLIPSRFQVPPRTLNTASAPTTPMTRNAPSPDWENFMDSIRNLVTSEVEKAQASRPSTQNRIPKSNTKRST